MERTLQPLTEVLAFPGHDQIEFPGEQIEGETNLDISNIEEIKPLPIPPRDTQPSGFAMPPPPRRFTPLPPRQFTLLHLQQVQGEVAGFNIYWEWGRQMLGSASPH